MENFTKMDCGCYVGFDVNHKPMWGKQCPLHKSAPLLYEACRRADTFINAWLDVLLSNMTSEMLREEIGDILKQALARVEGK